MAEETGEQQTQGSGANKDLDSLLAMLMKDFPATFGVKKGGNEAWVELNGSGRRITLGRDGNWSYE